MTDKELHQLKRVELLEMMTTISEENETLRKENAELKKKNNNRLLELKNAGSIAEASLKISGIFQAAQDAAVLYLENVKRMNGTHQETADKLLEKTKQECDHMKADAHRQADEILEQAKQECAKREAQSQREISAKWDALKQQIGQYCKAQQILKEKLETIYKDSDPSLIK